MKYDPSNMCSCCRYIVVGYRKPDVPPLLMATVNLKVAVSPDQPGEP